MYHKTELSNKIRVVTHSIRDRQSVAVGVWAGVGGRYEDSANKGVAHFLEHILFKGSARYSCEEIKGQIEGVGGSLNAFTAEEQTCYYAKVPAAHLRRTLDILLDMVLAPAIRPQDVARERTVILEEIKMYRDLPQYYVMELLDGLMWPDHPLGLSLAGSAESVGAMGGRALRAFHGRHYAAQNIVVSACGQVDHEEFLAAVNRQTRRLAAQESAECVPAGLAPDRPGLTCVRRDIEQMHLAMGFPGLAEGHKDKYILNLLHVILGGNMSSRLFHEVREKRGLAYSIATSIKALRDTGMFMIRAGVDNQKIVPTVEIILRELRRLKRQGLTPVEFKRAKDYYKGQVVLGLEDTLDHMLWIGEGVLSRDRIRTMAEVMTQINKIRLPDVLRVAEQLLRPDQLRLALVGPVAAAQEQALAGIVGTAV